MVRCNFLVQHKTTENTVTSHGYCKLRACKICILTHQWFKKYITWQIHENNNDYKFQRNEILFFD